MDVMIDLETFGNTPDCAVVQIGAVRFEPGPGGKVDEENGLNLYVTPNPAARVDVDTVLWWMDQQQSARQSLIRGLSSDAVLSERAAANYLHSWLTDKAYPAVDCVWSHGAGFDLPIVAMMLGRHGLTRPWKFWNERDTRTLFAVVGQPRGPQVDTRGLVAHNAMHDAIKQVRQVQAAMATAQLLS